MQVFTLQTFLAIYAKRMNSAAENKLGILLTPPFQMLTVPLLSASSMRGRYMRREAQHVGGYRERTLKTFQWVHQVRKNKNINS